MDQTQAWLGSRIWDLMVIFTSWFLLSGHPEPGLNFKPSQAPAEHHSVPGRSHVSTNPPREGAGCPTGPGAATALIKNLSFSVHYHLAVIKIFIIGTLPPIIPWHQQPRGWVTQQGGAAASLHSPSQSLAEFGSWRPVPAHS